MVFDASNDVSVAIPCCNHGRFLGAAIESALAQTMPAREVIVVDDGSIDDTFEVAARYPTVRYVRQEHSGVSAARNLGLRSSRGARIVFLDADDRLLPRALEIGSSVMASHPECAFVSGRIQTLDPAGGTSSIPEQWCVEENHFRTLLTYNYIWTPAAVMFRAPAIEQVGGFSPSRFGAEDWDLYLRIARRFPVHCHSELVAEYRLSGTMTSDPGRMLKDSLKVLRAQRPYLRGREDVDALSRGIRAVRSFYGDPLATQVGDDWRGSRWRRALVGSLVLLRYYPEGFRRILPWNDDRP